MKDTLKWDRRYLALADHISSWSLDPSRQIGAVVIGSKGQVLATGYNGFPRGIEDTPDRLNDRETKYKFMCHAEANAIYNATYNGVCLDGATIYVSGLYVCNECAKAIVQVGIKRVVMNADISIEGWETSCEGALAIFDESDTDYKIISLQSS